MSSSGNTKSSCESREENMVVNSVTGSREVEKYESGNVLHIAGKEDVVGDADLRSSAVSPEWNLR